MSRFFILKHDILHVTYDIQISYILYEQLRNMSGKFSINLRETASFVLPQRAQRKNQIINNHFLFPLLKSENAFIIEYSGYDSSEAATS